MTGHSMTAHTAAVGAATVSNGKRPHGVPGPGSGPSTGQAHDWGFRPDVARLVRAGGLAGAAVVVLGLVFAAFSERGAMVVAAGLLTLLVATHAGIVTGNRSL